MSDFISKRDFSVQRSEIGLTGIWNRLVQVSKRRKIQRLNRSAYLTLLYTDDRLLKDIGIDRADVEWAAKLPLDRNAALEIEKIRKRRRGK